MLQLLSGFDDAEWHAATECPAWDVAGIALHVLGDDLSLLARQRDDAVQGLVLYGASHSGLSFRALLDGFNEQWVTAATFLSPKLILDLLDLTGRWTAEFYREVDPDAPGEPVGLFAAKDASPYWQIAAREYLERWIHQHQIRRATNRPNLGHTLLTPAAEVVAHMIAAHGRPLELPDDATVVFDIGGVGAWTIRIRAGASEVFRGAAASPLVTLVADDDLATRMLSRALTVSEVASALRATGSDDASHKLVTGFSLLAGRP